MIAICCFPLSLSEVHNDLGENGTISVVLVRKLTAVHAFSLAVNGVTGPARRWRDTACVIPKRSATAIAVFKNVGRKSRNHSSLGWPRSIR
jgi:hypothetical protein